MLKYSNFVELLTLINLFTKDQFPCLCEPGRQSVQKTEHTLAAAGGPLHLRLTGVQLKRQMAAPTPPQRFGTIHKTAGRTEMRTLSGKV